MGNDISTKDIEARVKQVYAEIRQVWERYQEYQWTVNGIELHENGLDMLLIYLIAKGVIGQG
jgi:DNA-binding ferritin-like protein (Dps family)